MQLSTEDRLEIQELYFRFYHCLDAGDADGWAALFAPDGRIAFGPGSTIAGLEVRGTAELAAHLGRYQERYSTRGIRHQVTNIVIEPTENGAAGKDYVMVLRVGDQQPPQLTLTSRFTDELVKTASGWRFRSRTLTPDV